MKGLFIKDYCLLRKQKTAVIMILLLAVFFMITGDDPSMGVSYTIFVANSIIMGTQSYDEADHGMAFLMTLPTGRKLYVKEKYLFGIFNVFVLWVMMVAAGLAVQAARGETLFSVANQEMVISAAICLFICNIFYFVMLPAQLKYGPEKSRWVMLLLLGACFGILYAITNLADRVNGEQMYLIFPGSPSAGLLLGIAALVWIGVLAVSYVISGNIILKKEY
jgi:hypothetical protein